MTFSSRLVTSVQYLLRGAAGQVPVREL